MPAVKKTAEKKAPAAKKTGAKKAASETVKPLVLKKQTVTDLAQLLKQSSKTRQSRAVCVA